MVNSQTPLEASSISPVKRYSYRPEIDGIRAFAVIAVIINHFEKDFLPSGYLGVDIFFFISGFVITASLAGRSSHDLLDFLVGFYTRRIKRLIPALVLFVVITSLLICLVNPNPSNSLKTGIASLFGLSNLYLLNQATDYFSASTELNTFTHTWSLGVEEQFYFLFPLLVWLTGFGRLTTKGPRNLFWAMVVLSGASLVAFLYSYDTNQPAAYFLMPTRLWEMGAGCLWFLGAKSSNGVLRFLGRIPPLIITAIMVAVLYVPLQFGVQATIAIVALTSVLISCLRSETMAHTLFTHPKVIDIGRISYSLYLWHWGVLALSRWTIGIHWWSIPFQIALMLILAQVSYRYVETPLRHSDWSIFRWRSIGYGVAASVCGAILLTGLMKPLDGKLFIGNKEIEKSLSSSTVLSSQSSIVEAADPLIYKCNMTPHLLSGKEYRSQPVVDRDFIQNCISNGTKGKNKLVLVGDSFAEVSARHMAVISSEIGYDFRMIYGYGCPYPLKYSEMKSRAAEKCSRVDEELLINELIANLNKDDILAIRLYLPQSEYLVHGGSGKLAPVDAYDQALQSVIDRVRSKGAKFIVIGANPTLTTYHLASIIPQWFNRASSSNRILPSDNNDTLYFHQNDLHLKTVINETPGASFFSLAPSLCDRSGECPVRDGKKVLYSDYQHLTPYAHDLFFDALSQHIRRVAKI
jgi:peptidoglycan/LPS O-acetylase OafA/YrhL